MTNSASGKSADRGSRHDERKSRRLDIVELASVASFPASDPPPWTLGAPKGAYPAGPEGRTDSAEDGGEDERRD